MAKNKKLTNEDIDNRLVDRKIKRIGSIINTQTKLLFKCGIEACNHEWYAEPNSVIGHMKSGCPECKRRSLILRNSLLKLTNEIVDNRLLGRMILRKGEVINTGTKILFKCLNPFCSSHEWYAQPRDVVSGKKSGCPECKRRNFIQSHLLNNEIIDYRLVNNKIKRTENYKHSEILIEWECLNPLCNFHWIQTPVNILATPYCPICSGRGMPLSNEIIDARLIYFKLAIKRIGNFENALSKIEWQCTIEECKHIWYANPNNILNNNSGCPWCSTKKNEKRIGDYLVDVYGEENVIKQYRIDANDRYYKIDFVINNIYIEYHGIQHYEPVAFFGGQETFINQQLRDTEVGEYCSLNNLRLIEIPYYLKHEEQYKLLENLI